MRLLPTKARGIGDGERINEGAVPTSSVHRRLDYRGRPPPPSRVTSEASRCLSDDRVAFHQPYQGRHTGRTRAYGGRSSRSSSFRDRHAGAERVKRLPRHGSSRPSRRTRNVVQGSVLIPSHGRSSRFGHEADELIARRTGPNAKITSVCAGHRVGGAPRRNRTGDPILTMDRRPSAVLVIVFAAHDGPSRTKVCAQLTSVCKRYFELVPEAGLELPSAAIWRRRPQGASLQRLLLVDAVPPDSPLLEVPREALVPRPPHRIPRTDDGLCGRDALDNRRASCSRLCCQDRIAGHGSVALQMPWVAPGA